MIAPVQEANNQPDEIDQAILDALAENARMNAEALGKKVRLSGSAVRRRLKRLEEDHILKYTIVRTRQQAVAEAYVELHVAAKTDVKDFIARVIELPEVREAAQITGRPDVLLRVRAESNQHIGTLLNEIRELREVDDTKTLTVVERRRHTGPRSAI